jgi:hypothetical protein
MVVNKIIFDDSKNVTSTLNGWFDDSYQGYLLESGNNNHTIMSEYRAKDIKVESPIVFESDYIKCRLEILEGLLPKGYKIVKDNNE